MEFSQVRSPTLRALYDAYSFSVIPVLGDVVARDRASYQYLVESIRKFPSQVSSSLGVRDKGRCIVKLLVYASQL